MPEGIASTRPEPSGLHPGAVVGGRFEVVDQVDEDPQAVVWSAKDQQTKRAILVRVIRPELVPAEVGPNLRDACRSAATLSHRNIARVFGVGRTPKGEHFIAGEWIDGARLSDFIRSRDREGNPLSLRGIYNVVAHLCSALTYAHGKGPHGTLRPSVVWVTRGGRVKLQDFGVGRILLDSAGPEAFKRGDHACLAPEVKRGEPPTPRSDVFGIGAILYELLTNRSPGADFAAPSHVREDIPTEVDGILFQCLAPEPKDRFESPEAVRAALLPFVTEANSLPPPTEADAGFEIDLASVLPPPDLQIPALKASPGAPQAPPPAPRKSLRSLIDELSSDPKQRWMVARNKMDHGPFNARELMERLNLGDFCGDDLTFNTDSGERRPLRDWPEFRELVLQREHQDAMAAEQAARVNAHRAEKRSAAAKWLIAASVVGMVSIAVGGFLLSRSSDVRETVSTELDDLFKLGKITTGEAGLLPDRPVRRRRRGPSPAGAAKASSGFASYEDAMTRAIDIGDASRGGGEGRLTGAEVAKIMNGNLNRFYRKCVLPEVNGGGKPGNVKVDLAIAGNGSVMGATVHGGSASFQGCMGREISSVRFPTFGAPRMGARYSFTVN
ncbi:MAG: protein kinase [Myxococcales bacterium]|jgi:serine/threonine protein kinase